MWRNVSVLLQRERADRSTSNIENQLGASTFLRNGGTGLRVGSQRLIL
jgi:hypothetical protein